MKQYTIEVDNLKCGGCANTIKTSIEKLENVSGVGVEVETSVITVNYEHDTSREAVVDTLNRLGYPEKGTENTTYKKVKSYVSCATGRLG